MTHPFTEIVAAAAVVIVVGVGTVLVLPVRRVESGAEPLTLDIDGPAVVRAEPESAVSDAARVEALQRQLIEIGTEQKRLKALVKEAAEARAERNPPKERGTR